MSRGQELLTHTRIQTRKTCPRKHDLRFNLGIERERVSTALTWGTVGHLALNWLAKGIPLAEIAARIRQQYGVVPAWADEAERKLECCILICMIYGYAWRWANDGLDVIKTEQRFELPICNPETGKATPSYRIAGKKDRVVRLSDSHKAVEESKFTGESIAPESDYWKKLRLDHQVTLYLWAEQQEDPEVETIIYDVIHMPGLRPKKLTKAEQKKHDVERETLPMFEARLMRDIYERPDFYYQRQEVPRLKTDIDEFLHELWQVQKDIRASELNGRHYRNTAACTVPYRCQFLDICQNTDLAYPGGLPEGFRRLDYVHPELLENPDAEPPADETARDSTPAGPENRVVSDTAEIPEHQGEV